ncbi:MAG: Hpt domain-containing protein [Candidatus Methylomirabilales bacterium]
MDLTKYLHIFLKDSQEHLQRMDEQLLQLKRHPEDAEAIDGLFRSVHSIKGMSTTMGFDEPTQIAHSLESFLDPYRMGDQGLDPHAIDLLLRGVHLLRQSVARVGGEGDGGQGEGER